MVCPKAAWVELFIAGRLDDPSLVDMEAHIESCEECFLRVAVAAGDVSTPERTSLSSRSSPGSRLDRCLRHGLFDDTTIPEAHASAGADWTRRAVGPYVITGFLGTGGMSIVYRARHGTTGREVAVKTVKMPLVAAFLGMLRQEVEFLRETQHPGIVTVLDADLMADEPWYAMELFEGPTLHEFNRRLWSGHAERGVAAGGRLVDVLRLFARLCDPIGCIHAAGMVHGDIKPSNVFLRDDQQPVLMDFGLASRARGMVGREVLDVIGRIRGTLPYIAPEAIRGQIPDARVDLYSLGCMLYESIVGTPPFVSSSGARIVDMHLSAAPVPPSLRVSGVPAGLDELLLHLLAKSPRDRFGHARALAATLLTISGSLSSDSSPPREGPLSSQSTMPLFRPPLVGREAELAALLDGLQQARRSKTGRMFLLSGESGIGKTFFTAEVAQRSLLEGVQVITGECVPTAATGEAAADAAVTTPLQPFRRFFQSLRDRCHERGAAEVDRLFGGRLELLAGYIPALRYLRRDAAAPPARLPASAARERIVAAVVDTITACAADQCTLLAIDDLQWADDLSLAVLDHLDHLLARVPLIVLGTFRSDEAGEGIRRLAKKASTRELRLGRLDRGEIGAMVGGMLSMSGPPPSLVDFVQTQAEGVPFFAAEYLRVLVGDGALVYEKGAWTGRKVVLEARAAGRIGEPALPRTLQDLIRGRFRQLPPPVIELLEAGAVVGRRFAAPLIAGIVGRPPREMVSDLWSAVAAQITESDGFDGYTFLHDKIRETLYAGLSPARRAALHLAAARAMEAEQPTPPDQHGQIGYHYRKGGEPLKALGHLEKAGEHALAMAANADAERFFSEVLELEATLPSRQPPLWRASILRQRGDALQGLGMMADSADALKQSAALLGRPFPSNKRAFAVRLAREILRQVWHRLRPQAISRPHVEERATNDEVVRVFDRMHQASFYLGRDADLVFSTTVSLNASERAGPSPALAWAYTNAAMMAGVLPLPKLADHYFRLAATVIGQAPDPAAESWLFLMEGAYRIWHGKRERAIFCLEHAITLLGQHGFFRRSDEAECARIGIDGFAGFHVPALARIDAVEEHARRRRDLQIQCWIFLQKAEAHVIREDFETALAEITRVGPLLPSLGRPEWIWASGFESYVRCRRGESQAALSLLERALALISRGPPVHSYCVSTYDRLAETALLLCRGAPDEATRRARLALARQACSVLDRAVRVFPIARPAAALHRGALSLMLDPRRSDAVVERWRQATAIAQELSLPHPELRLNLAVTAQLDEGHPERSKLRQRAAELFRVLELPPPGGVSDYGMPPPLGAGVKIEGERQLPLA